VFSTTALLPPQVDRKRRHVNLTLRTWKGQQEGKPKDPAVGDLVAGRVVAVSGTGVRIQLGARLHGRVPLTDLHDSWRDNALEGACTSVPCLAQVAESTCWMHVAETETSFAIIRMCCETAFSSVLCMPFCKVLSAGTHSVVASHAAATGQGSRWVAVPAPRSWAGTGRARCV